MGDSSEALRSVALAHFARDGFAGASLQHIAADAGLSKSSVLYHFENKEALFDAAMRPALDDLRAFVENAGGLGGVAERLDFVDEFVNFLFTHRQAVTVMVNFGPSLTAAPVIREADALVRRIARLLESPCIPSDPSLDLEALRFGFGLAGAVYVLAASDRWRRGVDDPEALRSALRTVLAEVMVPGDRIATAASPDPGRLGRAS